MPKNKVNNNIKLKSGGGIINDADGLQVDDTIFSKKYTLQASEDLSAGSYLIPLANGKMRAIRPNQDTFTASQALPNSPNQNSIIKLSDSIVICGGWFSSGGLRVQVINTESLTSGTIYNKSITNSADVFKMARVSDTLFVTISEGGTTNLHFVDITLFSVSGTTISELDHKRVLSTTTTRQQDGISDVVVVDEETIFVGAFLAGYSRARGRVVKIVSGASLLLGTEADIAQESSNVRCARLAKTSDGKVVSFVTKVSTDGTRVNLITISGTTFTILGSDSSVISSIFPQPGSSGARWCHEVVQVSGDTYVFLAQTASNGVINMYYISLSGSTFTLLQTIATTISFTTNTNTLFYTGYVLGSELYVRYISNLERFSLSKGIFTKRRVASIPDGNVYGRTHFAEQNYNLVLLIESQYIVSSYYNRILKGYNIEGDLVSTYTPEEVLTDAEFSKPQRITGLSDLAPGQTYFVGDDGTLTLFAEASATTASKLPIGRAISSSVLELF